MEKTVVHAWSHGKTKFITQNLYQIHLAMFIEILQTTLMVIGTAYKAHVNTTTTYLTIVAKSNNHSLAHSLTYVL
jgi:hypothetical protein